MILIGRNSDRWHERRWHFAACVGIAAFGLGITTLLAGNLVGASAALSFAVIGIAAATPLLFTLVSEYHSAAAAAAGIALISSLGNLPRGQPIDRRVDRAAYGQHHLCLVSRDGPLRALWSACARHGSHGKITPAGSRLANAAIGPLLESSALGGRALPDRR
jgi:hypothetical protein